MSQVRSGHLIATRCIVQAPPSRPLFTSHRLHSIFYSIFSDLPHFFSLPYRIIRTQSATMRFPASTVLLALPILGVAAEGAFEEYKAQFQNFLSSFGVLPPQA